jgi:ribose 5-phosphate isomerase B
MSKVYFASDHAGLELKSALVAYVTSLGFVAEDMGAHEYMAEDDYPDYITPCAKRVAEEVGTFGIIIGKSGQGEAMAANRVPGARAVVFYGGSLDVPALARHHNNANVISLGAGFLSVDDAQTAVKSFLETPFSNEERHVRRLAKF